VIRLFEGTFGARAFMVGGLAGTRRSEPVPAPRNPCRCRCVP